MWSSKKYTVVEDSVSIGVAIRGGGVVSPLESNVGQLRTDGAHRLLAGRRLDGAQLDLGSWRVTEASVEEYLRAVGDTLPLYFELGLAPPIALAAGALGALLQRLDLPPGAVHSFQEIEALGPIPFGADITGTASLRPPRRRGDLEFITAAFSLREGTGRRALSGKSTVLVAPLSFPSSGGSGPEVGETHPDPGYPASTRKEGTGEEGLAKLVKTIGQAQLNAYAQASGDYNPLHLDPGFAAKTQFGGVIAHGMLTLAFISEMMAEGFGRPWLETGTLNVRFKGAAYLGDQVTTWGRVTKEERLPQARRIGCAVGVRNLATGRDLINGTATVGL
jgi:3-hydroxybutyryl-CoA dehydratase